MRHLCCQHRNQVSFTNTVLLLHALCCPFSPDAADQHVLSFSLHKFLHMQSLLESSAVCYIMRCQNLRVNVLLQGTQGDQHAQLRALLTTNKNNRVPHTEVVASAHCWAGTYLQNH